MSSTLGDRAGLEDARVVTAVVGAGPAGLLFCLLARILFERDVGAAAHWPIFLFDKRSTYLRSHRLRIAAGPVMRVKEELRDPRFDRFVSFLEAERFAPSVNGLERYLAERVAALGIQKELLEIGPRSGQVALTSLRAYLEARKGMPLDARLTIVGADSVHSTVRESVRGTVRTVERTHQTVARIQVVGEGLPETLGRVDRYRVSKVLGSIVDYRINPNGFAEVDAFLPSHQHERLAELAASPSNPIPLTPETVASFGAPFFARLIEHFRTRLTSRPTEVFLHSTFRLEHRYIESVTFADPSKNTDIFLVGDAAISLPFFRGMASLVQCAYRLAHVNCAIAAGGGDESVANDARSKYEREVAEIREREVATVRARARLVRGAREFARVSSLIPFPLQTWFLSVPERDQEPGQMTAGVALNAGIALSVIGCAIAGALVEPLLWGAAALQAVGGLAYRAAQEMEPSPDTLLRRVWLVQMVALFLIGTTLTIAASLDRGEVAFLLGPLLWLGFGYVFIAGMVVYDILGRRWFATARFDDDAT